MGATLRVLGDVGRNRGLRRVALAFAAFTVTEYAVWIAMLVYAYRQGGATAAGVVALAQLVPAAVFVPLVSPLADRRSPVLLLAGGYTAQAVALAATATAVLVEAPSLVVYAGAVVTSTFVPTIRPAQASLVPSLTHEPQQLTATNVVFGWVESISILVAGGAVGLALTFGGIVYVFAVSALLVAGAAVLVVPLRALVPTGRTTSTESPSAASGYAEVWHNPTTRLLLGLLGAEYVVIGALDLLFVIMAIDLLHASQAWAGYLNMAYGFGGVVFGAFAVLLIGRRLGPVVTVTATLLGAGLATTVLTSSPAVAAVLLTVVGGCRALFDLGTRTLLQRAVPADTVGLTFGVAESLSMAGLAVGSLLVPALVALDGARLALVGVSIVLPVIVLARLRILLRVDQQARVPLVEISLLRSLPLFQALPMPSLEGLARDLRRVEFGPGEVIVREGDVGDRYYAIVDGVVDITQHGGRIATLTRGDGLGEIALLRDSPRTATALASTRVTTYTLEREAFLSAINAHAPTRELASRTDRDVAARDARRQPPAS